MHDSIIIAEISYKSVNLRKHYNCTIIPDNIKSSKTDIYNPFCCLITFKQIANICFAAYNLSQANKIN